MRRYASTAMVLLSLAACTTDKLNNYDEPEAPTSSSKSSEVASWSDSFAAPETFQRQETHDEEASTDAPFQTDTPCAVAQDSDSTTARDVSPMPSPSTPGFWWDAATRGSPTDQYLSRFVRSADRYSADARAREALAAQLRLQTTVLGSTLFIETALVLGGAQFAGLKALPSYMRIRGALDISSTIIQSLPAGLQVQGTLTLPPTISSIPWDLYVGGDLDARLSSVEVSAPDYRVHGRLRTRFSESRDALHEAQRAREAERVREAQRARTAQQRRDAQGYIHIPGEASYRFVPRPSYSSSEPSSAQRVNAVIHEWQRLATIQRPNMDATSWTVADLDATAIETFSNKIKESPTYRIPAGRTMMGNLMMDAFSVMHQDPIFRATTILMMAEANLACGDRAADTLNHIEGTLRLREASSGAMTEDALYQLGLGFLKLDVVRRIARDCAYAQNTEEEIEVVLAFEAYLAERLALPITPRGMLYNFCANLRPQDYEDAARRARQAADDVVTRDAFFDSWEPWQEHLRRKAVAEFDWTQLPVRTYASSDIDAEEVCPVTREAIADLTQPVCLFDAGTSAIFEAEAFLQWWGQNGTHPITRERVNINALRRVTLLAH